MGTLFRSEEMSLCQIFLQSEAAYASVSELGELGLVQFKDLNPDVNAFQRKFVSEILRCDEMERKLRYMEKELKKDKMTIPDDIDDNPRAPAPKEMIDLEATFEKLETELREVNTNSEALKRNSLELSELAEVLKKTQTFFREQGADHHNIVDDAQQVLVRDDVGVVMPTASIQLGFVAGVIPREKVPAFERMLWFACRGNVFLRHDEIEFPLEDPHTRDEIHKCVFIVFFQGEQLKVRTRKICEGFRATLYPCPESAREREEMLHGVTARLEDLKTVLNQTDDHRSRVLKNAQKDIRTWIIKVKKIKAIYHTLNMCTADVSANSLIAECWCPVKAMEDVRNALQHGTELSGSTVPSILHRVDTTEKHPTFVQTNRFTKVFNGIVEAYGVATYREVNPALYTIISFPFLFAVMFGDTGHGFILFLFGLWMVVQEKKLGAEKSDNEIWKTFFAGRYIIMMMGLFSLYTGAIYNDIFSKSPNIFGSSWRPKYSMSTVEHNSLLQLAPETMFDNSSGPYPFGLDPIWQDSTNKITFTNSFKMKLSVILGISQMLLGVLLSIVNHIHFRRPLNIFCEFIPQLIFLLCIFGYMIGLIFYKWLAYNNHCTQCSPAILIHFINMFLMKTQNANETYDFRCEKDVVNIYKCNSQTMFYPHQQVIQITLLVLAVLMVPCMLVIKPFVLRAQANARKRAQGNRKEQLTAVSRDRLIAHEQAMGEEMEEGITEMLTAVTPEPENVNAKDIEVSVSINNVEAGTSAMQEDDEDGEEEFDFGEVFVNQAIHTIEYCLGCVSHTASYLRLWALSLAHGQLSEVLWGMLFRVSLTIDLPYAGSLLVFALFMAFAVLTIAVLLVMEGLSAFLHTLRLHWVEFQSKFYHGDGYKFQPFSFKDAMNASLDDK